MTQRDIAKDKEMCEAATSGPWTDDSEQWPGNKNLQWWVNGHSDGYGCFIYREDAKFAAEARQALPYYIDNYLHAIHLLEFDKNALEEQDALIERLRARISELEALLHPNNRDGR